MRGGGYFLSGILWGRTILIVLLRLVDREIHRILRAFQWRLLGYRFRQGENTHLPSRPLFLHSYSHLGREYPFLFRDDLQGHEHINAKVVRVHVLKVFLDQRSLLIFLIRAGDREHYISNSSKGRGPELLLLSLIHEIEYLIYTGLEHWSVHFETPEILLSFHHPYEQEWKSQPPFLFLLKA